MAVIELRMGDIHFEAISRAAASEADATQRLLTPPLGLYPRAASCQGKIGTPLRCVARRSLSQLSFSCLRNAIQDSGFRITGLDAARFAVIPNLESCILNRAGVT